MTAVALDTNLLLLFIVGEATGRVAGKRLKAYTDDDLEVLRSCLRGVERLVATPNVWTEVSNIWDFGIEGEFRREIQQFLTDLIRNSLEIAVPSKDVIDDPDFERLGLTDCIWLSVLDRGTTLVTGDVALCDAALSRGLKAVNFTHLRNFD
jgi:hypothetical protein